MTPLHLPTAYVVAGLLYLLMPMAVWFLLRGERSVTIRWWCGGGLVFGGSLVLLGFRAFLPPWLGYGVANGLLFGGALMRAAALRHELQRPIRWRWGLASVGVFWVVYEVLNSVWQDDTGRFAWSALMMAAVLVWVGLLARRLQRQENSDSARWLSMCYLALGAVVAFRASLVLLDQAEPNALHADVWAAAMVFLAVVAAIAGNLGFLGLFYERKNRHLLQVAAAQARQDEASQLGDQIAQLDRRRSMGEIAASLAHELSQPLTNIYLITDRLEMALKSRGDSTLDKYFEDINRNTQKAGDILGRIRGFIRGKETPFQRVELAQVMADVKALIHDLTWNESVQVQVVSPPAGVCVWGDAVQLSQILLNVCRNAVQATQGQADRRVHVGVVQVGDHAEISVVDNGPGFSPEALTRASAAFYTTKSDGLGVGLAIAKSIAKQHQGSLSLGNHPAGGGQVQLRLPALA